MKLIVGLIIYNRIDNLKRWLDCWKQCFRYMDSELVVIHNDNGESATFKSLCDQYEVKYIRRNNIGLDVGAFQDVCRDRLAGFPEWDKLLWVCDDTYPMDKNFIWPFLVKMREGPGLVAMKISGEVAKHVRTTGFLISKEVAKSLTFPADPITTKAQCYHFEHRGGNDTLTNQVRRMGLDIVQVAPTATSPLWDSEHRKRLDRIDEHDKLFGFYKEKEVTFICPIYKSYPAIISSLIMQTNPNWKLWLIHDGPESEIFGTWLAGPDERIKITITDKHRGNWGHSYRSEYLQRIETDFVVITNADNYHAPTFVEYLMKAFRPDTVGVYCSSMVHSYRNWASQPIRLERGHIDCAAMMLRTKEAKAVGWNDVTSHSADWNFFNDLIKKYGADRFVKREGCLLVHN